MFHSEEQLKGKIISAFSKFTWPYNDMPEPKLSNDLLFEIAESLISQTDDGVYYYLPKIAVAFIDENIDNKYLSHGIDEFVSLLNVEGGFDEETYSSIYGEVETNQFKKDCRANSNEKERIFNSLKSEQIEAIYLWLKYFIEKKPENAIIFEENLNYAFKYWKRRYLGL